MSDPRPFEQVVGSAWCGPFCLLPCAGHGQEAQQRCLSCGGQAVGTNKAADSADPGRPPDSLKEENKNQVPRDSRRQGPEISHGQGVTGPLMTSVLESGKFTVGLSHSIIIIIIISVLLYPKAKVVSLQFSSSATLKMGQSLYTHLPLGHPSHRFPICPGPRAQPSPKVCLNTCAAL